MTRTYSLATFFRMIPNVTLKAFFEKYNISTREINWKYLKQREVQPLIHQFRELPRETQIELEGIFQDVFELSCESGFEALQQAAKVFDERLWLQLFAKKPSLYSVAFWAWTAYRPMFDHALASHRAQKLSWWRKRDGLPMVTPEWNDEVKLALETALENYFVENQKRGEVCTVEMQSFDGNTYYFFAYPDDHLWQFQQHDIDGNLRPKRTRPTFEVVFAYNSQEGTLEIHAKGGEKTKAELENIFLEAVLGGHFAMSADSPYDLSVILNESFALTSDPEDGVMIQLKELRLNWKEWGSIHYRPNKWIDLIAALRTTLLDGNFTRNKAAVEYAKFQFFFFADQEKKGGALTFEITSNRCTLRGQCPKRVEIIRKHLKIWEIEHDTVIETDSELVAVG